MAQLTGVLLLGLEQLGDLVTDFTIGHTDVVLLVAVVVNEVEEAIVRDVDLDQISKGDMAAGDVETYELVLSALDDGDVHVVGRGAQVLKLLAGEDVGGDQMDLGVAVLASLGGRHVDNLARAVLDHDVAVLAQGRTLHGERRRRTGVDRLEGVLMLGRKESVGRCQD